MKKRNFLLCLLVTGIAVLVSACAFEIPYVGEVEIEVPSFVEDVLVDLGIKEPVASNYTVTFETNGGSAVEAVVSEGTIEEPAAPTKEGHTFAGWYLDAELIQAVEDFASIEVKADMTIYAKWDVKSFTVKFDTMGGTSIDEVTVEYGNPVAIPANPTKEGYEFAGWYLKKDYTKVYANDLIKSNTTLYARWRSAVRYAGTFEGEGVYNPADGTYSFTVQLQLWGRVRLVYNGDLLSMDDEELTVTGAFTSVNQAPWTPELYCDVPDETSTEVDWTTLLNSCANPVNYTFTYNPKDHSLDIQAEEILPAIPEVPAEGFYIEIYDNNKAFVEGHRGTADGDVLSGTATLKQWWRIKVYYNGQALSANAMTITGDFDGYNPSDKKLYIDLEWETEYDILCDYASEGVEYTISYNPTTNTLDIQDDEADPVVVIPTEGFAFEHTAPDTTLMAPEVVELGEDGTYTIVIDLAAWRYVVMYYNGVVLDSADENLSCTLSGGFYIDDTGNPSSRFYVNAIGKYQIVYNPTTHTLVAGKYVEPEQPDDGEDFVWTVASDQYAKIYSAGEVVDVKALWRLYIIVDGEGKVAYMCEMPKNGYGGYDSTTYARHSSYADYTKNPAIVNGGFVVPEGGFAIEAYTGTDTVQKLMEEITGLAYVQHGVNSNTVNVDTARLVLDREAGTVAVSHVEEEMPEQEVGFFFEYTAPDTTLMAKQEVVIGEDGTYTIIIDLAAWRYVVMYYNGVVLDSADETLSCTLSGGFYIDDTGNPSSRFYVNATGKYQIVYNPTEATLVAGKFVEPVQPDDGEDFVWSMASAEYSVLFTEGSVDVLALWRLYIIVDGEGKIAYMCEMPKNGYGGIASDTYIRHSSYADYTKNPAYVDGGFVVPEGGFALEIWQGADTVQKLMTEITGVAYAEHAINTNTINVDDVRLVLDREAGTVAVSHVENFVWSMASAEHSVIFDQSGTVVETRKKWRVYLFIDAEGKIAYFCEMPINGYGGIDSNTYVRHSDYADPANNPAYVDGAFVVPEGGVVLEIWQGADTVQKLMTAITGVAYAEHAINTNTINVDDVRLVYDAAAGTLTVIK